MLNGISNTQRENWEGKETPIKQNKQFQEIQTFHFLNSFYILIL